MSETEIGTEGAKALATGNLVNLTSLNVGGNAIGDDGAKALAEGNLTDLTSLHVSYNNIGAEAKTYLIKKLVKTRVL